MARSDRTFQRFGYGSVLPGALLFLLSALILSSCSSSRPEPRYTAPAKRSPAVVVPARPTLPNGWMEITSRSRQPQVRRWIVFHDYSATIVVRELQMEPAVRTHLINEGMVRTAEISLRGKVSGDDADVRVTRVPSVTDAKRNFVSYAYTEKGLLRRVLVMKKGEMVLEVELMQETAGSVPFEDLSDDLASFAVMLAEQ